MDIKILVAYHKESTLIENEVFMPVQVGKQLSNCILEMQGDNEGDNISEKNSTYCEMTAVYWAWKICHVIIMGYVIIVVCSVLLVFLFWKKLK